MVLRLSSYGEFKAGENIESSRNANVQVLQQIINDIFYLFFLLQRIHRRQAFHEMTLYFILLRQALLSTLPPPLWPRS